jgi:hypothetical protein
VSLWAGVVLDLSVMCDRSIVATLLKMFEVSPRAKETTP